MYIYFLWGDVCVVLALSRINQIPELKRSQDTAGEGRVNVADKVQL